MAAADKRKEYELTINNVKHTVLLSAEDADRYGKAAVEVKAKPATRSTPKTDASKTD